MIVHEEQNIPNSNVTTQVQMGGRYNLGLVYWLAQAQSRVYVYSKD